MSDETKPKIGAGHVAAMGRAGLKELSQILPAFPDGVKPVEEPGLAGNPTNIEVVRGKEVEPAVDVPEQELGQLKSPLAEIRAQVQQQAKASQQSKGKELSPEVGE